MGFRTLPVRSSGTTSTEAAFPFMGILKNFGTTENPQWMRGVYFDSSVYKSRSLDDDMTITGLLSSANPEKTDQGWQSTSDGDEVGIEIEFDTSTSITAGTPTKATIKSTDKDGDWIAGSEVEYIKQGGGGGGSPATFAQKFGRRVCFTVNNVTVNGKTTLQISQSVRNDLYIEYGPAVGYDSGGGTPHVLYAGNLYQD